MKFRIVVVVVLSLALGAARPAPDETSRRQHDVWSTVSRIQDKLSRRLGEPVAAPKSATSLQLSLENKKLKEALAAYLKALQPVGEADAGVVGYVFAINGRLNSAEIYPSNALFRKMWPKLIAANATEALGEKVAGGATPPSSEEVVAFLDAAEHGKASEKTLNDSVKLETREADAALFFETRRARSAPGVADGWVHRNYLAR